MSTDKLPDLFAKGDSPFAPAADPFGRAIQAFGGASGDAFSQTTAGTDFWDQVSEDSEEIDAPEEMGKRVLGEVESAFKARAQAEEKRMAEAVDSEYWIALVFQTRAQKDEFLRNCGANAGIMGDKYIEGPDFARLIGKPVTPVKVRYNISDKLDRRLLDMSRGFDELSGLETPRSTEGD